MEKIIEEKKKRGLKQPKYNLRKLSIGLVSCMIGFSIIARPVAAIADSVQTGNSVASTPIQSAPTESVTGTPVPKSTEPLQNVAEQKKTESVEDKNVVANDKYVKEIDEMVSPITKLYDKPEEIDNDKLFNALKDTNQKAKEKFPNSGENTHTSAEHLLPEKGKSDLSIKRKLGYARYNENYIFEGIAKILQDVSKKKKSGLNSTDKILKKETREVITKEKEELSKCVDKMSESENAVKKFYNKLNDINNEYTSTGFGFKEEELDKVLSILEESAKESKNILGRDLEVYYNL